jgi:hypothetical protein
MGWYDWFGRKDSKGRAGMRGLSSDTTPSRLLDQTHPSLHARTVSKSLEQPAVTASSQRLEQRRTERNAKRELLFQVVRECMVRVGVLSSAFKFKVLSLDQRGRSFLVMMELSADFNGEVEKLAEIETMIAQTAKHRFELVVQAVYWRYFNVSTPRVVGANSVPAPLLGAAQAPTSRPAPLFGLAGVSTAAAPSGPAAMAAVKPFASEATQALPIIGATPAQKASASRSAIPSITPAASAGFDDLGEDEVAAFRRALEIGASHGALAAVSPASAPVHSSPPVAIKMASTNLETARTKLLLTGYEDTEMVDDDPMPALSGTQYGELR